MSSPRTNFALALAIALALHALLAVALAFYLSHASAPDELAQLDLTSVELSFAETVEETSAAVASTPSTPVDAAPPPRPVEAQPPPPPGESPASPVDAASSPRQTKPKLPTPSEPIEKVKIEPKREVVRQEARDENAEVAPRQARVDAPAKPRRAIKPDYPRESRLRGEKGDVTLEIEVAADGSVGAARILKSPGYPLLEEAALKAARTARFTPAKSGGKPVASTVRLTLTFKLK